MTDSPPQTELGDVTARQAVWAKRGGVLFLLVALLLSSFLTWRTLTEAGVPGCGPEAGCHEVLNSKWSVALGMPVASLGLLLYLAVLAATLFTRDKIRAIALTLGLFLILGGALWFFVIQAAILKKWCPWCCATHLSAVLGAVCLFVWCRPLKPNLHYPSASLASLMVLGLVIIQVITPDRDHLVLKESHQVVHQTRTDDGQIKLSLHEDRYSLDLTAFPIIGNPDADTLWVVISDYTCPHCRNLHQDLHELCSSSNGGLGVVLLPGFRDVEAEDVHRLMLTLWQADPILFEEMTQMINLGGIVVNAASIREAVADRLDSLDNVMDSHKESLHAKFELAQRVMLENDQLLKVSSLPQIMLAEQVLAGQVTEATLTSLLTNPTPMDKSGDTTHEGQEELVREGEARIEFETILLKTPEVVQGEFAKGTFVFSNEGDAPLTITNIKTSCGCTKVDGWEQTVKPGESGSFTIKVDSKRFTGKVIKSVVVTSNAANVPDGAVRLKVELNVYSPVRVNPNTASFGNVLIGTPNALKTIRMTVTDGPIEFGTPTVTTPEFAVSVEPIEATKVYELKVAIPNPKLGSFGGSIIIPVNHPRIKQLRYPVYANIVEPVVTQPKKMGVGRVVLPRPTTRSIVVTCHDKAHSDFKVLDIQYSGSADVAIVENKAYRSGSTRYQVTIPAGFDAGAAIANKERIIVRTSHPDYPKFELPFE